MNRAFNRVLVAVIIVCGSWAASTVRADDMVDNPRYTAWAKFKPGSTNTLAADMDRHGNKVHIEVKRTLISISDTEAVIETKAVVNVMDHDHEMPATQETIKAKANAEDFKQTGEQSVDAMGKTFKCKVYEAAAKPDATVDRKEVPGTNMQGKKATVYASDDVPGGVVKLETDEPAGKTLTFILTAMDSQITVSVFDIPASKNRGCQA